MNSRHLFRIVRLSVVAVLCIGQTALAQEKMPAETAGAITAPTGKLAFIRNGHVAVMNADGTNQKIVGEVSNADGRLSWSPDGKTIVYTRSGSVDLKGPDMLGGTHRVYDIFVCFPDSARNNNRMFWQRLTDGLGSRDPEWSADGTRMVYWKDLNANQVNAFIPNYQICISQPDGSDAEYIRKDWQTTDQQYLIRPTLNANGDLACVYFEKQSPVGTVVLAPDERMLPLDSIKTLAVANRGFMAPAWSPDGRWLAVISNDLDAGGLYIATPDMSEKYLVMAQPPGTYLSNYTPSFSPDGKWLTASTSDGSIWIVDITGNGARRLSGPGPDRAPAWSKH